MDQVRTERLEGTRPLLRDAEELHPVCADPRVAEWVFGDPLALARVRAMLVRDADHWKRHRFGVWVVRDAATRAVVGRAGLSRDGDGVELDWLIAADRWGEGLATEISRAALDWAFGDLGLDAVTAKTLTHNTRSRAVMERLGMTFDADVVHAGRPHVRYVLRSEPL